MMRKVEKYTKGNIHYTIQWGNSESDDSRLVEPWSDDLNVKPRRFIRKIERAKKLLLRLCVAGSFLVGGAAIAVDSAKNSWNVQISEVTSGDTLRIENVASGTKKTVKICGIEAPSEADRDSLKELLEAKRGRLRIGFMENPAGKEEIILQVRTREEGLSEYENAVDRLDRKGKLSRTENVAFIEPVIFGQNREYYSDICLNRGSSLHIRNDNRGFWEGWNWTQAEGSMSLSHE